jgi:hypothetical protein
VGRSCGARPPALRRTAGLVSWPGDGPARESLLPWPAHRRHGDPGQCRGRDHAAQSRLRHVRAADDRPDAARTGEPVRSAGTHRAASAIARVAACDERRRFESLDRSLGPWPGSTGPCRAARQVAGRQPGAGRGFAALSRKRFTSGGPKPREGLVRDCPYLNRPRRVSRKPRDAGVARSRSTNSASLPGSICRPMVM